MYGESWGSAPRASRISVRLLVGVGMYMKDLVYSILREQVGNAATTEECWNFICVFIIVLTIMAVPLVMISDYSNYFMRIFTDYYTNFMRHFVRYGRFIRVSLKYLLKLFSFNIYHDSLFSSPSLSYKLRHSNGRSLAAVHKLVPVFLHLFFTYRQIIPILLKRNPLYRVIKKDCLSW
jgi:hypothetical protein